jgi:hypothetical protein
MRVSDPNPGKSVFSTELPLLLVDFRLASNVRFQSGLFFCYRDPALKPKKRILSRIVINEQKSHEKNDLADQEFCGERQTRS